MRKFVHLGRHDSKSRVRQLRQWHLADVVFASTTASFSFVGRLCLAELPADLYPTDEWKWVLTFMLQVRRLRGDGSLTQAALLAILQDDVDKVGAVSVPSSFEV